MTKPRRIVNSHQTSYADPIRVAKGAAFALTGRKGIWDADRWLWAKMEKAARPREIRRSHKVMSPVLRHKPAQFSLTKTGQRLFTFGLPSQLGDSTSQTVGTRTPPSQ